MGKMASLADSRVTYATAIGGRHRILHRTTDESMSVGREGILVKRMCAVNASGNLQKCDLFYENKY